jgi:5-methylcytosine-specific restriction endonuclease McrA
MCGTCGFKPTHPCQLDVDHIDGNHSNDSLDNLQTLCANCHRLKTYIQRHNPELV